MMRYGYGYGYTMLGGLKMIIPLILLGLVIFAVVKLSQGGRISYGNERLRNDALDILNQRYAKGEISDEEYEKKKRMLRE